MFSGTPIKSDLLLIGFLFIGLLLIFGVFFAVAWWIERQRDSNSPYSGKPLRRAEYLSFYAKEQVLRYLYDYASYDNRMFKLSDAALCRETGRIFPNALTWYGVLYVDWKFLQKRLPGHYVSWGSLSMEQQEIIRRMQGSLKGYQTEFSSPRSSPREIEPEYAFMKPGPLYVNVETHTLVGWKSVPGTDYEVLIVQRPPVLVLPESLT
jgi:hypothetical protein